MPQKSKYSVEEKVRLVCDYMSKRREMKLDEWIVMNYCITNNKAMVRQ